MKQHHKKVATSTAEQKGREMTCLTDCKIING